MSNRIRALLPLLCLVASGCDLGRADVVTRSPDLGPPISVSPVPDAAAVGGDDAAAGNAMDADAGGLSEDGPADRRGPDLNLTTDVRDALADQPADIPTAGSDAACRGDVGGECGASSLVMTDDFEDGAAGWMSAGTIWTVTADSTSLEANSVLCPTGPAASSVYYSYGAWQDMTASVRLRVTSFGKASSTNRAEVYARFQDPEHFYGLSLRSDQALVLRRNATSLGAAAAVSVAVGEWHVLQIKVSGPAEAVSLEGYFDGVLMVAATDTEGSLPSAVGTVGVGIYGQTVAVFDDVTVSSP